MIGVRLLTRETLLPIYIGNSVPAYQWVRDGRDIDILTRIAGNHYVI